MHLYVYWLVGWLVVGLCVSVYRCSIILKHLKK